MESCRHRLIWGGVYESALLDVELEKGIWGKRVWRRVCGSFRKRAQRQAARRANYPRETCSERLAVPSRMGQAPGCQV
jgi:hypothetical protein